MSDWKLRNTIILHEYGKPIGPDNKAVMVDFWPDGGVWLWDGDRPHLGNTIQLDDGQLKELVKLVEERDRWVKPKLLEPPQ